MKKSKYEATVYLLLYVDDMLIARSLKEEIEKVKRMLESEFEKENKGAGSKILCMQIIRDRTKGTLVIAHRDYIAKVMKRFNMNQSKAVLTPMAQHFRLSPQDSPKTKEKVSYMEKISYANVEGSLMYAMICS